MQNQTWWEHTREAEPADFPPTLAAEDVEPTRVPFLPWRREDESPRHPLIDRHPVRDVAEAGKSIGGSIEASVFWLAAAIIGHGILRLLSSIIERRRDGHSRRTDSRDPIPGDDRVGAAWQPYYGNREKFAAEGFGTGYGYASGANSRDY